MVSRNNLFDSACLKFLIIQASQSDSLSGRLGLVVFGMTSIKSVWAIR